MNTVGGSVQQMVSSSILVLTQPSVPNFERFEKQGTMQKALIYVALGAVIAGLFGIFGGLGVVIRNVLSTLINFLVFTYATHYIGQRNGGTGTLDEVAYTFSLFITPLMVLSGIVTMLLELLLHVPVLNILAGLLLLAVGLAFLVAEVYIGHIAVQSSMNLESGRAWRVLGLAALATFVVLFLVTVILHI